MFPDVERALNGAVVLVVDDGEPNVLLLQRLLTRAGAAEVVGVTDPRVAVEQFVAVQPDLVLLDMHMPHLDGVQVLEALSTVIPANSFTPVVVITADTTLEAKQRALVAGAMDFVTKPFEQSEVLLRAKNLLEKRAMHQALQHHNAALAAEVAANARRETERAEEHARRRAAVQAVIDGGHIEMVFQPIVDLETSDVVGYEALSRFPASDVSPYRPPNEWFADANAVGLGAELELLAIRAAAAQLDRIPGGAYLSVNASPESALRAELLDVMSASPQRFVLELTEHAPVEEYGALREALARLRAMGVRIAVDDAGAGFSSLRHILRLCPDVIKLDIDLTTGIDGDPVRRALAASLVAFADEIGASITAEGIETAAELDTLRHLRVQCGQGFHLARPGPLPVEAQPVVAPECVMNRA